MAALKGFFRLVELMAHNVGLSPAILSQVTFILQILQRVISMFVLEALLLIFMTTPLVIYFYLPHLRHRIAALGGQLL